MAITDQEMFDLAGLRVDGSPVAAEPWDRPPLVWIDGDRLRWKYVRFAGDNDADDTFPVGFGPIGMTHRPLPTTVRLGILFGFVDLPRRDLTGIPLFASQWGVLHLCHHQLPRTHPQVVPALPGDERREGPFCQTVYGEDVEGSESLVGWVWWALRARSVLRIASTFRGANKVNLGEEWATLLPPNEAETAAADSSVAKSRLGSEVETWLRVGAVRPRIDLLEEPHLRVGGVELFGMIALQLASAVTGGSVTFCTECGAGYVPKRQPVTGRRNYCEDCRASKVPQRDAARDSRRRPPETRRPRRSRASP